MQVIADLDLQMPGDVAVVGFDDVYAALSTNPPLTTVRQPRFKMGARAAEILISQLISGNLSSVHEVLPVELVVRDSTVS
jgi:DNA-binding LacI/PurR family transcriptional regulator